MGADLGTSLCCVLHFFVVHFHFGTPTSSCLVMRLIPGVHRPLAPLTMTYSLVIARSTLVPLYHDTFFLFTAVPLLLLGCVLRFRFIPTPPAPTPITLLYVAGTGTSYSVPGNFGDPIHCHATRSSIPSRRSLSTPSLIVFSQTPFSCSVLMYTYCFPALCPAPPRLMHWTIHSIPL